MFPVFSIQRVKELIERVCHFHNQSASLVTGIVHHQRNLLSGIRGTDFLQKFADYFRINRSGCPNAHEIMVACLNGAENAVTLPPTSTWNKDPGEGPNHPQKGTQYEFKGRLQTDGYEVYTALGLNLLKTKSIPSCQKPGNLR